MFHKERTAVSSQQRQEEAEESWTTLITREAQCEAGGFAVPFLMKRSSSP